jgi:hypothetical protein
MTDIERLRELPAEWRKRAERKKIMGLAREAEVDLAHAAELEAATCALLADYERLRGMEERVKGVESLLRKSAAEHEESCGARRGLDDASRNFHEGLSQAYEDGADMLAVELGFADGTGKPVALVPVLGGGSEMSLRGFGMTFDLRSGGFRNWYIDGEGAKRWADNDELVRGLAGLEDDPRPTPEAKET